MFLDRQLRTLEAAKREWQVRDDLKRRLAHMPFWIVLVAVARPPEPSQGQFIQTGLVALLAGVEIGRAHV